MNDLEIVPDVIHEKGSDETRLRDAILVIEKAKGGHCPYCNPSTRGKRKFQPVKLGDCKKLWIHGQQLSACLTLVSKITNRYTAKATAAMAAESKKMLGEQVNAMVSSGYMFEQDAESFRREYGLD